MISSASTAGTAKHARFGSRSRPASGNSRLATPTNRPNAASNPAIEAQIHLKPPTIAATFRARLKQKSQSPLVLRGIPYNPYTRKGALLDLPAETGNHHHLHLDMQQPLLHCPAVEKRGCTHALPAIQAAMTSPSTLRRTGLPPVMQPPSAWMRRQWAVTQALRYPVDFEKSATAHQNPRQWHDTYQPQAARPAFVSKVYRR